VSWHTLGGDLAFLEPMYCKIHSQFARRCIKTAFGSPDGGMLPHLLEVYTWFNAFGSMVRYINCINQSM